MVTVTYESGAKKYDSNAFFQYDYGQELEIIGLDLPEGTLFHFANKGRTALTATCEITDGTAIVEVPQSVLEQYGDMNVYIYHKSDTEGKTIDVMPFYVKKREKPTNPVI